MLSRRHIARNLTVVVLFLVLIGWGLQLFYSKQQKNVEALEKQISDLRDLTTTVSIDALERTKLQHNLVSLEKDRITLQNGIYVSLTQALGGAFFFITAYFTWRNLKIAEEKQITDRFSEAVKQLGNSNERAVRLGSVYSMERISEDSERYYWTVMEVLTSFVQDASLEENSQSITSDTQAALTVVGRRRFKGSSSKEKILNLSRANLMGANLIKADLVKADLSDANLNNAFLTEVKLSEAILNRASLCKAKLQKAHLENAKLQQATLAATSVSQFPKELTGSDLLNAKTGARLNDDDTLGADLTGAFLMGADLSEADLRFVILTDADLSGAELNSAYLQEAKLGGAILEGCTTLESAFLGGATYNGKTKFPADFSPDKRGMRKV